MKKKKIIFVITYFTMGGIGKSLINLCKALNPDYYEITVLILADFKGISDNLPANVRKIFVNRNKTLSFQKQYSRFLNRCYGKLVKTTFNSRNLIRRVFLYKLLEIENLFFIRYVKKLFNSESFDFCVGYTHSDASNIAAFSIKAKKTILFYHEGKVREHINDINYYKKSSIIVTVSQGVKNDLIAKRGIDERKLIVLHNIYDTKGINRKSKEPCGFNNIEVFKICTVARISKEKNIIQALESAKILSDAGYDYKWLFVGPDNQGYIDICKKNASEKGIEKQIEFTGLKENPFPFIRCADIYVQPSEHEALPGTVAEAMILGKPIVSTATHGAKELISDGENGILCGFKPEEIAQAILRLVNDNDLRERIADNAKLTAQGFDHEIEKYDKLFSL